MIKNVLSYISLFFIALTLYNACSSKRNNFWDIKKIIVNYFKMFNNSYKQIIMLFIFPIFYAISLCIYFPVNKDILNNINLVVTILTSLFFAFIGFLCSINYEDKKIEFKNICNETFNLMCFEILCSMIIIILSFGSFFILPPDNLDNIQNTNNLYLPSGLVYYLLIITILNVFIILKRVERIFSIDTNINK